MLIIVECGKFTYFLHLNGLCPLNCFSELCATLKQFELSASVLDEKQVYTPSLQLVLQMLRKVLT